MFGGVEECEGEEDRCYCCLNGLGWVVLRRFGLTYFGCAGR